MNVSPIRMHVVWRRGPCVLFTAVSLVLSTKYSFLVSSSLFLLWALPTLIPFLNSIRIFELLELFKLTLLSRLLYFQFFNLANTYLSPLKYVGTALLFVRVSGGFTKGWQIEMSLSVDLYQIVEFFLVFIFYLKSL